MSSVIFTEKTHGNFSQLVSITFEKDYAFYVCISLSSITLPNSIALIGNGCFDGICQYFTICVNSNAVENLIIIRQ
ncbi:MAG: leucine-rich repeat domain-containing protein [Ureaplasma sp.]|nr:leucine-rich repeat domain-containing protein [Ureaplasma sp.]